LGQIVGGDGEEKAASIGPDIMILQSQNFSGIFAFKVF